MMGLPDREKKFYDIFSHLDNTQTDQQTDRHRPTAETALTYSVAR